MASPGPQPKGDRVWVREASFGAQGWQVVQVIAGKRRVRNVGTESAAYRIADVIQSAIDAGRADKDLDAEIEDALIARPEPEPGVEEKAGELNREWLPWVELRQRLGRERNRAGALRLLAAIAGYEPQEQLIRAHLADPGLPATAHKLILGGIGAGKTWWGVPEDIMLAILNPGRYGAIMAPTYDQVLHVLLPVWEELTDAMAANGYPLVRRYNHSIARADLVCGGRVFFRSFDRVDNLRGYTFAWGHLDESEQVMRPGYVWNTIAGRIRDPGANILQLHATTTPQGNRGVVRKFMEARTEAEDASRLRAWWACRVKTTENHHLPESFLESLRAGYSQREYEQEIEARVLKPSHVVWPEFERGRHVVPWDYDDTLPFGIAADWGYNHPHILFIQITASGAFIVFDEIASDEWPEDKLKAEIKRRVTALNRGPQEASTDRADKKMNAWLRQAFSGMQVHTMRTRKQQRVTETIESVRRQLDPVDGRPMLYFAEHLTRTDSYRGIVACMEGYRWRQNQEGQLTDEPLKDNIHDHGADAIRYWCASVGEDRSGGWTVSRTAGNRMEQHFRNR